MNIIANILYLLNPCINQLRCLHYALLDGYSICKCFRGYKADGILQRLCWCVEHISVYVLYIYGYISLPTWTMENSVFPFLDRRQIEARN